MGYDFQGLYNVTRVATKNLNKVIDRNYYPTEEARRSNMRHRPIGLGVQGLADAYMMMRLPSNAKLPRGSTRTFSRRSIMGPARRRVSWPNAMVHMRRMLGHLQAKASCSLTFGAPHLRVAAGTGRHSRRELLSMACAILSWWLPCRRQVQRRSLGT